MRELSPEPAGKGRRVAIAVSRFHETVTHAMLDRCVAELRERGVADADITVAWVAGAFELPTAASWLVKAARADAVIALGCIIRGETTHDRVIAHAVAQGLNDIGRASGVPVVLGVLTVDTFDQAQARVHRGADAARTALEMAALKREIG